ncbi:MAG: DMT family transporter [Deltaproteobacteria bacterium]|nr:DMT family transporter [Deltaproteobacteria bacterium]
MKDDDKALLFGLATVLLWSTVASAFKLSLRYLAPAELLLWAAVTSSVVLGAILAVQGRLRSALRPSRGELLTSVGFGLLNPALYYVILFEAYARLPAQEAQALNYTWALTLTFLSVPFLKRPVTGRDGIAAAVCYLGAVVIATRGRVLSLDLSDPAGVGLALLSTLVWSTYWILNTKDRRDPVTGQFLSFLAAVPVVAAWVAFRHGLRLPPTEGLLGAAYVGTFEMGVAFVLWLKAMKLTSSTARISNLIFISPLLSLGMIYFVLGEPILPSTLVGLVLILGGLATQQLGRRR